MSTSENNAQTNGTDDTKIISPPEYFKSIGQHVEQEQAGDDDAKPVEEIESLCMNCRDNVSWVQLRVFPTQG